MILRPRALVVTLAGTLAPAALTVACSHATKSVDGGGASDAAEAAVSLATDAGEDASAASAAARKEALVRAREALDAGRYQGPELGAANMVVSVLSAPLWPETDDAGSQRLGYLRHGAKVPVLEGTITNDECTDGWYELVQGGFVCGKAATTDIKNPRVKRAPKGPDLDAGLPYRYGYNLTNGTPLYRRVLSIEDRKKYEPWLAPKPPEPAASAEEPSGGENGVGSVAASNSAPAAEEETPEAPKKRDRGDKGDSPAAASASATPWYLRPRDGGGKPDVTLGELRGRGVLVRRMVRGFFLALDRDFRAAGARWWRTTYGFAVPFERIVVQPKLSDYHGFWVALPVAAEPIGVPTIDARGDAATGDGASDAVADSGVSDSGLALVGPTTPKAFAFVTNGSVKLTLDRVKGKLGWAEALPKRRPVALTGERVVISGVAALGTTEGFFVRESDVKLAQPAAPPSDLGPNEKWIDVDLTRQMLVAFEGTTPVFGTLISSGKRNLVDKDKDHPTPPGIYRIREKHVTSTMDGDVAADGPYSIEDVPWVMYFQGSFALHGAFWHDGFGGQRSHGCLNLAPEDARSLFRWTEPPLPEGWHGVFATDARPGTRIVIHEDPPPKRR